jgi:hypothetical protein
MKNIRALLMSFLVVACTCIFTGCATTSDDSYTPINDSRVFEKKQPSPTEDMADANTFEKACYYLLQFAATIPYGLAGGY